MDCSVWPSPVIDCGIEVLTGSYPRRLEVNAVVDCSVDQYAVVDCGFTSAWGIAALCLSMPVGSNGCGGL